MRTNAAGPFLLTQALAAAPGRRRGKVANLSSMLGSIASVDGFHTPSYAISKAAQNMATVLLAHALRERGITRDRAASGLGADRHGRHRRADHADGLGARPARR